MIQRYDFAPLDGITKVVFRQVYHRMFGGADRYFIPFFSPTDQHILTKRDQRELDPAANAGLPVVPQVMTRRAPDFLWAAEIVADMGYTEVNLNLGCPSGTVTAKGKGAGFLAKPEELERFFDEVFAAVKLPVSVKTRLGVKEPEDSSGCWTFTTVIPSPASPSTPGCRSSSTRGPCTGTGSPGRRSAAGIPCATTGIW